MGKAHGKTTTQKPTSVNNHNKQQPPGKKDPSVHSTSKSGPDNNDVVNKPRNMMVTDATTPLQMSWTGQFGTQRSITVQQTADPETWPGGAVWDLGWCLAQLMIGIAAAAGSTSTVTSTTTHLQKSTRRTLQLPSRVTDSLREHFPRLFRTSSKSGSQGHEPLCFLELGCGVGLTGLVTAAAFANQAKAVVLTDLPVVIDQVTQPNVMLNATVDRKRSTSNTQSSSSAKSQIPSNGNVPHLDHHPRFIINKGNCQVVATPLCWGNREDEDTVAALFQSLDGNAPKHRHASHRSHRKTKESNPTTADSGAHKQQEGLSPPDSPPTTTGTSAPHVILIGDVAYQHAPGAPSHFDALVSTLLRFLGTSSTLVIFGTRIRMPASVDLTNMLLERLESVVEPPLSAHEIDSTTHAFANNAHTMSIYFLRWREKQS